MSILYKIIFSILILISLEQHESGAREKERITSNTIHFLLPENWKSQAGRVISIPVKIYKSINLNPGAPILWFSGGPGMTNLDYEPPKALLANHDVVLVGYRGVDGPLKLDCEEVSEALKGIGKDLLSEESVRNVIQKANACSKRLISENIDLNGFTMEQILLDIDTVIRYLGYDKVNILSGSYGTRLAQLYSKFYTERVHRVVMIGTNVPGRFVWEPELIEEKIRDYDEHCQNDSYCQSQTKSIINTFNSVLDNLPDRWLIFPIDKGKVRVVTFAMMYHNHSALQVIDAYITAEKGDYSGIAALSMAYNFIMPDLMVWGEFFSKGMIDYNPTKDYRNEFSNSEYTLGSPLSELMMDVGEDWPTKQPVVGFSKLDTSDVQTLVLNGSLDFSTPHEVIEDELIRYLPNSKLVIFNGLGHVADLLYKKTVIEGITNYYDFGEVNFTQTSFPVNFEIDNGFSKIVKIGLLMTTIITVVLLWVVYKLIQRLRRKLNYR
ncbi:MAG: alpha/beta hydrolase [Cyclobacteriaceae bacterium]